MQHCESCGSDLPLNAHFCGNCGRLLADRTQAATGFTYPPVAGTPAPNTPPLFSSPSYPNIAGTARGWEDADATLQSSWSGAELTQSNPQFPERSTGESRAVLPDMLLPGMLAVQGQIPSAGQAPMVQGTPQVGGVPSVQGAPATPGSAPPSVPGLAHGAGSAAPSPAPTWEQHSPQHMQPHYPPVHHPQPQPPPYHPPVHHPHPTPPPHPPEHHLHHHHHTGPLHAHRPHAPRLHGSTAGGTSKLAIGAATKWLVVALAAAVVVATSSIFLVHALMPATPLGLTYTGSSVIPDGGVLHLHGQGFIPGNSVKLTIDNGIQVFLAGQHESRRIAQEAERSVHSPGLSQMFIAGAFQPRAAADTNITVSSSGTFDAGVTVPRDLSAGKHTIYAAQNQGSQSASLQFTVPSPKLAVNPTALKFGSVEVGRTVKLSVMVSNQGGSRLNWTATAEGSNTKWLTLQNGAGAIEANGSDETVTVTANTNGLPVGPHSATLHIHSDNGDAQISVKLNVIPHSQSGQQAILNVPQRHLDFGQLQAGQQVQQSISIANLGNLPLKWQASSDAASASWLTLTATSGTVQPGATPQTVQVVVNTGGLHAGNFSATITINSNGGNTTVPVTLTVTAPPIGGSPTPSPTIPPPLLSDSPNGFSVPGDPNCTYKVVAGWTCTATLSSLASAQSNLNWSASSSGVSGVTFSPPKGTLLPGQSTPVAISIPNITCPASAAFTFIGPANQVLMPWSCGALTLTTSKTNLNGNTDCTFSNGWTCNVTLSTSANAQGQLSWSTSSSGVNGISFNPPNGILTAGQSIPVTITVPSTACPASANLTFSVQGGVPVTVSWSCGTPTIKVSPASFTIPTSNCSYIASQGWSCKATVSMGSPGDPSVSWSVSGGLTGTTFSPSNGLVSAGSPVSIRITVPDAVCPTQANITFSGQGANTVTVPWSCAPPTLTAAATPSNCPPDSNGNYICTDTVSESASSQGSLIWSASASNNLPGVTFNPPNGTLDPNGSKKVTITVPANDCRNGSFNYSEQGTSNTAVVTWTCTPPQAILSVSPGSFNSNNCKNNDTTWICTATLTSNATLKWYATSNDPSAISFDTSSGTVSPGQPVTVTVYIPYSCPSSATISFVGPSNTVQVQWSC
jgi:hypothetical protein